MKEVRCKLGEIMRDRALTILALHEQSGVSQSTISRVARNKCDRIDKRTIEALLQALDINDIGELFEVYSIQGWQNDD